MDFPHGVTVSHITVTTTRDDDGNEAIETVEADWGPVAMAPRFATESPDPRVPAVVVGKTFYGPTADIDSDDLIVVDGVEYEVDGLPEEYTNPFTGWAPGIVVQTKRGSGV